ncbi:adenylyl-sulfate kinase [Pseudomonas sp. TH41]|uniref:adenylyl-sulfate kinase n=1 Tax=Pseudomonas sp. TH41 TaxID=2796405 RepID=UPI001913625F|nr:adenylyl-sulfate kinase [Pseudomonas sp. TH41]MBK5351827.1 adenylyl-sulfate kinase [Pseudomonas sp. TH41]
MNKNLTAVPHALSASDRKAHYGHCGAVLWLTGLSASGKSSLAMALELALTKLGYSCYVLDGDNVRKGLNANLGFSAIDRTENIRRVGETAALFADAGLICITAFISPYREDRARARDAIGPMFHEIHIAADLATCEARDPKGLYKKAHAGELLEFTGVSAPYEVPEHPELALDTSHEPITTSLQKLISYVTRHIPLGEPSPS